MNKLLLSTITTSLLITGCGTPKKSALFGAGVGATLGGSIGNAQGKGRQRNQSTLNGVLFGAALGGILGYFSKSKKKNYTDQFGGVIIDMPRGLKGKIPPPPRITKPIVTVKKVKRKKVGKSKVRSEGVEWVIKRGCEWVVE